MKNNGIIIGFFLVKRQLAHRDIEAPAHGFGSVGHNGLEAGSERFIFRRV